MADEPDAYQILGVSPQSSLRVARAAYWRLARRFHPDGTTPDHARMTQINAAYEAIERERIGGGDGPAPGAAGLDAAPIVGGPPGSLLRRMRDAKDADSSVVDFGQYAGWRIADIARQDPRYLRWLSRQASGIRYRAEIERTLGNARQTGKRAGSGG